MCFFFSCAEDWQTATTEALPLHYLRGKELPSLAAHHTVRPAKPLWGDVEFPYYSCGRIVLSVNLLCQESYPPVLHAFSNPKALEIFLCPSLFSSCPSLFDFLSPPTSLWLILPISQLLTEAPPSASWVLGLKVCYYSCPYFSFFFFFLIFLSV